MVRENILVLRNTGVQLGMMRQKVGKLLLNDKVGVGGDPILYLQIVFNFIAVLHLKIFNCK